MSIRLITGLLLICATLIAGTTEKAYSHSESVKYFTNQSRYIHYRGAKSHRTNQIIVITDGMLPNRINIHKLENIYVVCVRNFHALNEHKKCHMIVIVGDQIIEEIDGHPAVTKNHGNGWHF
jgi:hypothetical protein